MNFKERLDICNVQNNSSCCDILTGVDICDIFVQDSIALNIISNAVKNGKNLIVASNSFCDKSLIFQYFKSVFELNSSKISISPVVDILKLVSFLESTLTDSKQFVFGLNLKTYKNILKTIKTIILIHYPNLKDVDVENLLGLSDVLVVYVSKNEDGIFVISDIGEIEYIDDKLSLNNLYTVDVDNVSSVDPFNNVEQPKEIPFEVYESETKENIGSVDDISASDVTVESDEIIEANVDEEVSQIEETSNPDVVEENNIIVEEEEKPTKKVNKYKLLKEKIKNKKAEI